MEDLEAELASISERLRSMILYRRNIEEHGDDAEALDGVNKTIERLRYNARSLLQEREENMTDKGLGRLRRGPMSLRGSSLENIV